MTTQLNDRSFLTRFAWLSIAAALTTIALKTVAYFMTGSVGLLSDALESVVNLVGALVALAMLTIAARPADETHAFGHSKAEYFSSAVEGMLILVAALSIGYTAIERLINPQPLEKLGIGLAISVLASLVNLGVALVLRRAGKKHNSITLDADAQHLLTDVWTSGGVLVGVGLVAITGWQPLDSISALLVAANITWSGYHIIAKSVSGLMDSSLPPAEIDLLNKTLEPYKADGVEFHAMRTRQSASERFVSLHVLVPGEWTVNRGHKLLERIEADIRTALPSVVIFTHLESLDDPASWDDPALTRPNETNGAKK
jgi:cation diffusion facilitator family transporter